VDAGRDPRHSRATNRSPHGPKMRYGGRSAPQVAQIQE
jgi:hypothetical protein